MKRLIHYTVTCATAAALVAGTAVLGAGSASADSSKYCSLTSAQPEIEEGSTGLAVAQAQCELNWGFLYWDGGGIAQDEDFGPITKSATESFQECAGLTQDGIIGPQTWAALNRYADDDTPCNDRTITQ